MSNTIFRYSIPKNEEQVLTDLINSQFRKLKYTKDKKSIIKKINELQSRLDEILNNHIIEK